MSTHVEPGTVDQTVSACSKFIDEITRVLNAGVSATQNSTIGSFDTARQIGTVYSLFSGEDLNALLNEFVAQAEAMSMLFAAAGGLIEAQDEEVAAALSKAAQEPAGMQSVGLMGSLGVLASIAQNHDYARVGPEDVSTAPLEQMAAGAKALDPNQFGQVRDRVTLVADALRTAGVSLSNDLNDVLGSQWQGHFATEAQTSVKGLTDSALQLADSLDIVVEKARGAEEGYRTTESTISSETSSVAALEFSTPGFGTVYGPVAPSIAEEVVAARQAAEEQARAVMNTVYSPAVMDANLDGIDFPTAYRVVSGAALGGPNGVDLANAWNAEGVIRPAQPVAASEAAIAAVTGDASGGGADAGESGAVAAVAGGGAASTDAATEQALLASRTAGVDGAGAGAATGPAAGPGTAGAAAGHGTVGVGGASGGGVNAGTAAAAAGAPMMNAQSGQAASGGGVAGARAGGRGSSRHDRSDRGFGSAAGLVGGGGAAAAGAGAAARMGGAGTLSGLGASGALGAPGTVAGGPGAPLAGTTGAGGPAGAFSSSSTGGATASRAGGMPMGMMGAAGAAGRDDKNEGHRPASYLVNATNASEILGEPVKVSPARIGTRPDAPAPVEREPAPISPAQALVNRLKGR